MKDPKQKLKIINFKTKLYKAKGKGKMDKAENSSVVKKNYLPRNLIYKVNKFKEGKQIQRWGKMS